MMNTSDLPKGAFGNGVALAWDSDNYIYALNNGIPAIRLE